MSHRKKLSRRKSKKMFSRGATHVQSANTSPAPMRGGFRI